MFENIKTESRNFKRKKQLIKNFIVLVVLLFSRLILLTTLGNLNALITSELN